METNNKLGALSKIRLQIDDEFEKFKNNFHVTFIDTNGGKGLTLPFGLVLQLGSIIEYHHDKYLIFEIDYINKEILATKIHLTINGDSDIVNQ